MINKSKIILALVFLMSSVQVNLGQDVDIEKLEQKNEAAKAKQNIQIASENLKEISIYVDDVKASLDSASLSVEQREFNREKLKTLSVLKQAAADILRDLIAQVDSGESELNEKDDLMENTQQVLELANQVYTEQIAPTLQAVFEVMDGTSDDVASGESQDFTEVVPNIYANIGQTEIYQSVMDELHNTFRESATTPEGGGFGENDATPN